MCSPDLAASRAASPISKGAAFVLGVVVDNRVAEEVRLKRGFLQVLFYGHNTFWDAAVCASHDGARSCDA